MTRPRHAAPPSRRLFTVAAYGSGLLFSAGVLALLGQRVAPHANAGTPPAAVGAVTVQTGAVGGPLSGVETTTAAAVETSAPLSAPVPSRKAPTISVHRSTVARAPRVTEGVAITVSVTTTHPTVIATPTTAAPEPTVTATETTTTAPETTTPTTTAADPTTTADTPAMPSLPTLPLLPLDTATPTEETTP
jgi:hypothetical protein